MFATAKSILGLIIIDLLIGPIALVDLVIVAAFQIVCSSLQRKGAFITEITPREIFLASVQRCMKIEEFVPAFYLRFTSASDDIGQMFRFTNFENQNKMLARSLELCAGATAGEPEALAEVKKRAQTHSRDELNIAPRFYDIWLECIVETAAEFDPDWDETVEAAWNRILNHVIRHMVKSY